MGWQLLFSHCWYLCSKAEGTKGHSDIKLVREGVKPGGGRVGGARHCRWSPTHMASLWGVDRDSSVNPMLTANAVAPSPGGKVTRSGLYLL